MLQEGHGMASVSYRSALSTPTIRIIVLPLILILILNPNPAV